MGWLCRRCGTENDFSRHGCAACGHSSRASYRALEFLCSAAERLCAGPGKPRTRTKRTEFELRRLLRRVRRLSLWVVLALAGLSVLSGAGAGVLAGGAGLRHAALSVNSVSAAFREGASRAGEKSAALFGRAGGAGAVSLIDGDAAARKGRVLLARLDGIRANGNGARLSDALKDAGRSASFRGRRFSGSLRSGWHNVWASAANKYRRMLDGFRDVWESENAIIRKIREVVSQ